MSANAFSTSFVHFCAPPLPATSPCLPHHPGWTQALDGTYTCTLSCEGLPLKLRYARPRGAGEASPCELVPKELEREWDDIEVTPGDCECSWGLARP